MKLEAVLFDCDGVIADNEKFGHQVAFNKAFKNMELGIHWDNELYKKLLKIGGGKERLNHYFENTEWPPQVESSASFIRGIHNLKSEIYSEIIKDGKLEPRPGVIELMNELVNANIPFGICSTSKKESVESLISALLPKKILEFISILIAGDMVTHKKPSPEIYLQAIQTINISPQNCLAIEDSKEGFQSAKSAGLKVLITKSYYTKSETFNGAIKVLDDLSGFNLNDLLKL